MSDFNIAIEVVLKNEGGLSQDKKDLGGISKFGISLRLLKNLPTSNLKDYGIFGEPSEDTIVNLTVEQAKMIYLGEFWAHAPFGKIENQEYCNYIFDMCVNMGISPAIKCVQRATWAVQKKWQLLPDDGILGDATIAAIAQCGFMIMPPMRAERGSYYRAVVNAHPEQKDELRGWYDRTYGT